MKYLIYWLFERKIIKDNNIFSRCLEKILLCFAFIYKKKKLNLDQALQTENRDPSKKCTDSNTQKQLPFVLEIYKFFYYLHSDISKDLPQPEVWKQLAWLHLAEGSRWQSKC